MKNVHHFSTTFIAVLMVFASHISFGQDENVKGENLTSPPPPPRILSESENTVESPSLVFFPNPCSETLNVILPHPASNYADVSIYSLTGKKVWNATVSQQSAIDVSKLITGIYIINCNGVSYKFQKI